MTRTDVRPDFPSGGLEPDSEDIEPGITARWSITPNTSLNAAVNPDFSQVEADAAQLDINERFALFFPEKTALLPGRRGFFLHASQCRFHSNRGGSEVGCQSNGKRRHERLRCFPDPRPRQQPGDTVEPRLTLGLSGARGDGKRCSATAATSARPRRSELIYTGREGDSYHNRVGGIDGFVRLSASNEIRFQFLRSDTLYPEEVVIDTEEGQEHRGNGLDVRYRHQSRNWAWRGRVREPRSRLSRRQRFHTSRRRAHGPQQPNPNVLGRSRKIGTRSSTREERFEYTENFDGALTDREFRLFGNVQGPMQSFFEAGYSRRTELLERRHARGPPSIRLLLSGSTERRLSRSPLAAVFGQTVDINNNRQAGLFQLFPSLELKLGRHVNVQLDHTLQRLDDDGPEIFTANLSEVRLFYHFNLRTFVRAIFQYRHITRNPELFVQEVEPKTEQLFTQFLFSYKLNPQTVVFVGYSDTALGFEDLSLTRANRTFFVKLGYAWLL